MATPLEEELARKRIGVDQFLAGRGQQTQLDIEASRADVEARGGKFFEQTLGQSPQLQRPGFARAIPAAQSQQQANLRGETMRFLAGRERKENVRKMELVYNNAVRRAEESGFNKEKAVEYAQQQTLGEMDRVAREKLAGINRTTESKLQDISEETTRRTGQLQEQYAPQNDYNSALNRALFGLGGGILTAGLISQFGKQPQSDSQSLTAYPGRWTYLENLQSLGGPPISLRQGSGFSNRLFDKPFEGYKFRQYPK